MCSLTPVLASSVTHDDSDNLCSPADRDLLSRGLSRILGGRDELMKLYVAASMRS